MGTPPASSTHPLGLLQQPVSLVTMDTPGKKMAILTRKKNRWGGELIGNILAVYITRTFERGAAGIDPFAPHNKRSSEIQRINILFIHGLEAL